MSDRSVNRTTALSEPIATGLVKNWKEKAKPMKVSAAPDAAVLSGLDDKDASATKPEFKVMAKASIVPKFNPSMIRDTSQKNEV